MKSICLLLSLLLTERAFCQRPDSVDARVYLATHVVNELSADAPLVVHFVAVDTAQQWVEYQTTARKIADNHYRFPLDRFKHYLLVFEMGNYTYRMTCLDNRQGKSTNDSPIPVLLRNWKFGPGSLTSIPSCVFKDEED
jgi:hypothetical protein